MPLSHIAPVFRVADLARAIAFYRDALGFELEFCYEDFYASVRREGCHVSSARRRLRGTRPSSSARSTSMRA